MMHPFQVDPGWYNHYWYGTPRTHHARMHRVTFDALARLALAARGALAAAAQRHDTHSQRTEAKPIPGGLAKG